MHSVFIPKRSSWLLSGVQLHNWSLAPGHDRRRSLLDFHKLNWESYAYRLLSEYDRSESRSEYHWDSYQGEISEVGSILCWASFHGKYGDTLMVYHAIFIQLQFCCALEALGSCLYQRKQDTISNISGYFSLDGGRASVVPRNQLNHAKNGHHKFISVGSEHDAVGRKYAPI